jgi:hypothetical protein
MDSAQTQDVSDAADKVPSLASLYKSMGLGPDGLPIHHAVAAATPAAPPMPPPDIAISAMNAPTPADPPLVDWLSSLLPHLGHIYLWGFLIALVWAYCMFFVFSLRGITRRCGPSAVFWGLPTCIVVSVPAAFISALAWPMLIFVPLAFVAARKPTPVYEARVIY